MHTPVLLQEVLEGLQVRAGSRYIDATAGEGGHIRGIMAKGGEVLAIDWDNSQIEQLKRNIADPSIVFVQGNYADIAEIAAKHRFTPVDGILFDFGLSMRQYTHSGKGLSYKNKEEPLDMRLDESKELSASDIINSFSEQQLYEIFARNAEEFHSVSIAQSIVFTRLRNKLHTVGDLLRAIDKAVSRCHMGHRHGEDVYARVFQAIRIEVNYEFGNIQRALEGAVQILSQGGRILTISFHSLEDRLIKNFIKTNKTILQIHKHAIRASQGNRFERSAKLRIMEKRL